MAIRDSYPMLAWRNWIDEAMPSSLSTSSIIIGSSTQTFAVAVPAPAYYVGAPVTFTVTSNTALYISATLATWNPSLGSGSFTVRGFSGSGTYTAWDTVLDRWHPDIGSYYSTLPLTNLEDDRLSIVARSTANSGTAARLRADFGMDTVINMVCFPRHNLSENSKWRIRLLRVAAATGVISTVYDTGFIRTWPTVTPFGVDLWGVMPWGGRLLLGDNYDPPAVHVLREQVSTTSVTTLTLSTGQKNVVVDSAAELYVTQVIALRSDANNLNSMSGIVTNISGTTVTVQVTHFEGSGSYADWTIVGTKENGAIEAQYGRLLQIDIDDNGNKRSYVQFGRLVAGPGWQPSGSIDFGWDLEHIDDSKRSRSRGGQFYVDIVPKYRRIRFTISGINRNEMYSQGYEIDRVKGVGRAILTILDPSDPTHLHRLTIYGSLAQTSPIAQRRVESYEKQFVQEEWV